MFNYKPLHELHSSSQSLLNVPLSVTHSYGDQAFSTVSAELWNDLQYHLLSRTLLLLDNLKLT
ncbi:hypothetical protein HOLleu_08079 [Holothuria leucospilota]|uniref:Uncharacterized protein n=1 Tax=Holothuria leucospilota TaxID=206669 RepID=A0A9Q1CGZ1_HOLLE|nr:hypothetical protein HOLleu_08079 [Holothuria leucospilota]